MEQFLHMVRLAAAKLTRWWVYHKTQSWEASFQTASPTFSAAYKTTRIRGSWCAVLILKSTMRRCTTCCSLQKLPLKSLKSRRIKTKESSLKICNKLLCTRFPRWNPWWPKAQITEKLPVPWWTLNRQGPTQSSPFISRRRRRPKTVAKESKLESWTSSTWQAQSASAKQELRAILKRKVPRSIFRCQRSAMWSRALSMASRNTFPTEPQNSLDFYKTH